MHSRIIQISHEPVEADEYISPWLYCDDHWFVPQIADYVAEDENRDESIEWFFDCLSQASSFIVTFEEDGQRGFILKDGFRDAYFSEMHQAFINALQDLADYSSYEHFRDGELGGKLFSLKEAYDEKLGMYVESNESGLITLTEFLRGAEIDRRYFIGGTLDYHF